MPRPWRVITFGRPSTVWDGARAFGVDPNESFDRAFDKELPPGKYRPVLFRRIRHRKAKSAYGDLTKRLQDRTPPSDSLNSKMDPARLTLPRSIKPDLQHKNYVVYLHPFGQ